MNKRVIWGDPKPRQGRPLHPLGKGVALNLMRMGLLFCPPRMREGRSTGEVDGRSGPGCGGEKKGTMVLEREGGGGEEESRGCASLGASPGRPIQFREDLCKSFSSAHPCSGLLPCISLEGSITSEYPSPSYVGREDVL